MLCLTARKTTKTSIILDFLPLFHIKHRLKSHISTPLNLSALPHDRRQSKDKTYRAVQARVFHSPAIHPLTVYTKRAALCNFASIWAYLPDHTRYTTAANTLCAIRHSCSRPARSNHMHARTLICRGRFKTLAQYIYSYTATVSLYIITLCCFYCVFFSFAPFDRFATDRSHRTPLYPTPLCFCPHATRQTRYPHPDCKPAHSAMRPAFISHALHETYTQYRRKSPRTPAFAAELPFDAPPRLFRLPLFPQAVQGSAFLCVLVSCGTYVLSFAKTSTFIEVFARLCIFIHCVIACFSPIRLLFPSLRSFPRCRSAADDRASAPLRRFCFRAPHRRLSLPFSSALVCIPFFRGRTPSFFDFSISFCLMLHGARKLFVCFSLPSAFCASLRGSAPHLCPSLIRLHLKLSPLPNLSILLDTVPLLLYNYLAFACESPLFVYCWLYKATRSDRPSAVRSVEQRHKTTTK